MSDRLSDCRGAPGVVLAVLSPGAQRDELSRVLADEGRAVCATASVGEALELLARARPDVLLVEITALEAAGVPLVERLRARVPWAALVGIGVAPDAATRRSLLQRFELFALHDPDAAPERLRDLVDSLIAIAGRTRRALADAELRDLIVAKLCHEIRTCLFVIEGYTEILCDAPEAQGRHEVATRIAATGQFALELVQDYLDLAKLDRSETTVAVGPTDLEALAVALRAETERRIGTRPLRLRIEGMAGAPVLVDGAKLRCILAHLLAQAVELASGGEIRLVARVAADVVDFLIVNHEEQRASEHAHQTNDAARANGSNESGDAALRSTLGASLGLAIALRLSRLLGATLEIDPGGSSAARFSLRVPARSGAAPAQIVQGEPSERPILH